LRLGRGFNMGNTGTSSDVDSGAGYKRGTMALRVNGHHHPEAERARASAEAEHLSRDFARVRARLAVDPALVGRSLAAAWTTDVMQEDEAEFVDTLADCMGAGLSLETALTGWDSGTLASEPMDDALAADEDEVGDAYVAVALAHRQTGARRVLVR
jgi:hypothetical protein